MMEEKKKLMIIDDDVDFVKDLSRLLRTKGYQVVSVTNSKEALQAIYKEDPDLILLDIMMPGIDGWNI
ncbi:MAG TPA: response regulator, partial [Chloroflexi bacterium]|nr:response regulator [Chloroflexota bacterium]